MTQSLSIQKSQKFLSLYYIELNYSFKGQVNLNSNWTTLHWNNVAIKQKL